jgi:ABC-type glycerol-3-phosphate transport system substrate-binding protein
MNIFRLKRQRIILIPLLVMVSLIATFSTVSIATAQMTGNLTVWCMNFSPHVNGWTNVINGYMAKNPGANITLEPQAGAGLLATYKTAMVSGQGGDIFTTEGPNVYEWSISGQILPLSPEVMSYEDAKAQLFPEYILQSTYNDQLWAAGIPDPPGDAGLIANVGALETAGLEAIGQFETREQMLEYAKALAQYDGDLLVNGGLSFQESNNGVYFYSYIVDQGGSFWNNETQQFDFNTPEAKNAMQFFLDLYNVEKVDSFALPNAIEGLLNGTVSMALMWPEFLPFSAEAAPDNRYAFIMKPSFNGDTPATFGHSDTWSVVVPKYTQNQDLAFDLLRYLMSEEGQLLFLDANPGLSPLRDLVFNNDYYVNGKGAYLQPVIEAMQAGRLRFYGPWLDGGTLQYDILWPAIQEIMNGTTSIDDGLALMTDLANEQILISRQRLPDAPDTIVYLDALPEELAIK